MVPLYDVYSALVYAASAADVRTVLVNGRQIVRDRRVLTVDVEKIKRDVRELQNEIAARAAEL